MIHSVEILRQLLRYDAATGKLFWLDRPRSFFKSDGECKRWNGRYAGAEAFTLDDGGYLSGYALGHMHRAHRVAWALHHGTLPSDQIDHINGLRADNRIENLRDVPPAENSRNARKKSTNTSGHIGVGRCKGKWRATIWANGRQQHLGLFSLIEDAVVARSAAQQANGYHANHGTETARGGYLDERAA